MKYEIAQQLKTTEREHEHNNQITIKVYEWVITATGLTWGAAKARRKARKGARIYPMHEQESG